MEHGLQDVKTELEQGLMGVKAMEQALEEIKILIKGQ